MNIKNSILLRARIVFLIVFLVATAIIYRIVHLQMVEGDKWEALSKEISLQYMKVNATRGNILADDGSPLATSLPFYRLAFDPSRLSSDIFNQEIDSLCYLLSNHFMDRRAAAYKRLIMNARENGRQYVILNRKLINYQEKKMMSQWPVFRYGRLKGGAIFEKRDKRFMPFTFLAHRTIGYTNENLRGAGLEFSFNKELAGRDGEALYQKMAGGNWKPVHDGSGIRPVDGYDLVTTLDVNLQDVAQDALLRALTEHEADHGSLILMEVKTGEIKAIVNLSKNSKGHYAEIYNYAVGEHGLHEPGSTFKLATMIALLEETDISLSDSIETGEGTYQFYNNVVRDHMEDGFGKITIREAFEKSSNIAMAKLADQYFGLKPQKFYDYLEGMHLTRPIGFQIVGEGKPKIKTPDKWSGITLPWMAYGYGLELTPLHMLTLYNAVANDGKMIRPIIVKSINNVDREIKEYKPFVLKNRICSEETLQKLRTMLEGVVINGTATNIKNDHYSIAGKTGTAQLLRNRRYTRNYRTSFIGYFPAEQPMYSCIVVIEDPKGYRQYGSSVAAPVFKEVADKIYASNIKMHAALNKDFNTERGIFPVIRSGYREDLTYLCNKLGVSNHSKTKEAWVKTAINNNAVDWTSNLVKEGIVPDVIGMTLKDAIFLLENNGLDVRIEGMGRVAEQSLLPGTKISKGTRIKIKLN